MSWTACRTLSIFFSKSNSGVCTPITTRPWSLYFSAQARTYGSVRSQLMQVYVQKSTSTTLPRRPAALNGGAFSHPVAPASEGMLPSTGNWTAAGWVVVQRAGWLW